MKDNLQNINFMTNFRFYNKCFIYNIKANNHLNNCDCSGVAMARGILDSLMSATYFNASALRLLRQLVSLYFCPFLPTFEIYFWQPKPTFYPYAARFPWVLQMSLRLHLETSLKPQESGNILVIGNVLCTTQHIPPLSLYTNQTTKRFLVKCVFNLAIIL